MITTHATTVAEARRLYAPKLRRGEVISLCSLFGHSESVARSFIEGPDASVKGKAYGPPTRCVKGEIVACKRRLHFDREEVIAACL